MFAPRTIFSRLMLTGFVVIFLCVGLLFGISSLSIRDNEINARLAALTTQAQDIADLAVQRALSERRLYFGDAEALRTLLEKKLRSLYEVYDAYSLIVDTKGNVTSYFLSIIQEHQELASNFDSTLITENLLRVLNGETISNYYRSSQGPMLTVAIPIQFSSRTIGAVYIQTAAQSIQASFLPLAWRIGVGAAIIYAVTVLGFWFISKRLTSPLQNMALAAKSLARGEFQVEIKGEGTTEIEDMALAFNSMAQSLSVVEQTRKDFIANISHELSSPITSIHGFVEGILDGTIPEDEQKKYLTIVKNESIRLNTLVRQLLDLSKMESGQTLHKTTFDIHECIRRVIITKINALEQKSLGLSLDFDEKPLYVFADQDSIEQVLINLIDNAIKYTPDNGEIHIQTKTLDTHAEITVRDNGIGILSEDAPHIFDRFYMAEKAHTSGAGTGLGLAISKKIIDNHQQNIYLLEQSQGTAMRFTLALAKGGIQ
jgi:signal transduction histidine kinase